MFTAKGALLNQGLPLQQQIAILEQQIGLIHENLTRIRFGDGADDNKGENIDGQWILFTTSGTPDAENTIAHGLGATPIGYIICGQDKAGSLYNLEDTGTAWTASNIFLKCDVATVKFRIFLQK